MQVFGRQDFQYLYDNCFSEHDRGKDGFARFLHITDEGVFHDAGLPVDLLRWKPVHELAGPNKPPSSGPALPFPFTASQLAAFMLWGWGSYFQDAFGRLDCGPNEFVLNGDHEDAADAYEALRQAYVIYQDALRFVDELDHEKQQRAHELSGQLADAYDQALEREKVMERVVIGKNEDGSPKYGDFFPRNEYLARLARAKEAVASQKVQALQAKAEADVALKTWRRAMVRQLLQPHATTTPSPAPVVAGSASGNVEELDYSVLARPAALLDAFEKWGMRAAWFDELDSHKWLLEARRKKGQGQRGNVIPPLFCPYAVMCGLMGNVRKQTRLKPDTAWRILEHKFPKVHAAFESHDTRDRTGD